MSFGRETGHTFSINGATTLPRVDRHKVLGFWLDCNLSFSHHHELASKSAFRVLNMIRRSFPRISKDDFPIIFGTYIRPLLEYGSQIVHSGLVRHREILERVQRASTKAVRGLSHLPYPVRLSLLNLYPLDVRRVRRDPFLMFHPFNQVKAIASSPSVQPPLSVVTAEKFSNRGHALH